MYDAACSHAVNTGENVCLKSQVYRNWTNQLLFLLIFHMISLPDCSRFPYYCNPFALLQVSQSSKITCSWANESACGKIFNYLMYGIKGVQTKCTKVGDAILSQIRFIHWTEFASRASYPMHYESHIIILQLQRDLHRKQNHSYLFAK